MFFPRLIAICGFASSLGYGSVVADTGGIDLGYLFGYGFADFGGPAFHAKGTFEWGPPAFISGILTPTTTVPVNGQAYLFNGTLTYSSIAYSIPNPVSDTTGSTVTWTVTGSPIIISGPGTYSTPVTGSGVLRRRVSLNPSAPYDVDDTWTATGTSTITVSVTVPPGAAGPPGGPAGPPTLFQVTSQTYDFTATPEPGACGLIAGALVVGGFALRRRRRIHSNFS